MTTSSAPPILTPLVGRAGLLSEVRACAARLVTLTGPPGVGKTRLARELFEGRGEGATWIDLGGAVAEDEVQARVADGLGLRPSWLEPVDLVDELGWAIEGRGETWVVLDEAESCVDALRRVLPRWLALAPELRALVTSRERLGVADEALFDVPPLEPDEAVALLRARSGLETGLEPLAAALDGVPLALEIAAARLTLLSPDAAAERLPSLLDVLTARGGRARGSLRDTLQGAWLALDPEDRRALARCGVFAGPFTVDAAEAVVGEGALDALQRLRDRSLVARRGERLQLYAPIRSFAREQDAGDAAERHADHFEARAERLDVSSLDELRAAHAHRPSRPLALALARLLVRRGPPKEALDALEDHDGPVVDALRGRALETLGRIDDAADAFARAGDLAALASADLARGRIEEARAHAQRAALASPGDPQALRARALVAHAEGRLPDARVDYGAALDRAEPGSREAARLRADVATVHLQQRRLDEAREGLEAAIAALDPDDAPVPLALAEGNLAILLQELGELDRAEALFQQGIARLREVGHLLFTAHLVAYAGALAHERGDAGVAAERYRAALSSLRRIGDARLVAVTASAFGALECARGRAEAADERFEEAARAAAEIGDPGVARTLALHRLQRRLLEGGDVHAEVSEALDALDDDVTRRSDDARLAVRLLRGALGHGAIVLTPSAHRLTLPDGAAVDLGTRELLWRLVDAFAEARVARPGAPLDVPQLIEAGWPGEKVLAEAAPNRVKVALSTLRKLGLRPWILRGDGGWFLDPSVPLRRA